MENKAHAFAAGAFVLVLLGLIVGLVLWFTRDETVRNVYELSTRDAVSGLQPQAMVRYRGIAVGRVTSIDFDPKVRGNVRVRISVDERVPLTTSSYASLSYQGVTGLAFIALDDNGASTDPLKPDNSNPPRIPLKPSTLAQLQERGTAILDQAEQTAHKLNQLLGDANQQRVSQALENIAQAAASANRVAQRLDTTLQSGAVENAGQTLSAVKKAATDVSRVANNLNTTVSRLNESGAINRLAEGTQALGQAIDSFSGATLPRVNQVADDTSQAVRRLGRAAEGINDNPQSLLFGSGQSQPGPGEPGFSAPPPAAARP